MATSGLSYTLSDDSTYYICTGIGTATDTDIVIASEYEGLPVKEIGAEAFRADTFTTVIIPDSVTTIGVRAFAGCYNLTSVIIGNGVTTINTEAFTLCSALLSVTFGSGVTEIGSYAFYGCSNCLEYNFSTHTAVPALSNTNPFYNIDSNAKIIVPNNLYEEWIVAENWSEYASYIERHMQFSMLFDEVSVIQESKTVTVNGTVTPDEGYIGLGKVEVEVPVDAKLGTETVTNNNTTYNASDYGYDGFSSVDVQVYVKLGTKEITTNDTYTAEADGLEGFSSVTVAVPEKQIQTSKTVTPSTSTQTVTPTSGYDGLAQVIVNPAPLIENTYVSPTTELQTIKPAEGSSYIGYKQIEVGSAQLKQLTATSNGEYVAGPTATDPVNYIGFKSPVVVNVPLGTKTITANGEYVATTTGDDNGYAIEGYRKVTVSVPTETANLTTETVKSDFESTQTITPAENYDGFSSVTVEPIIAGAITATENQIYTPANFTNSSGETLEAFSSVTVNVPEKSIQETTKNIISNGTYNASSDGYDGYSSVTVQVPTDADLQSLTATENGTYTPADGYDGFNQVVVAVPDPVLEPTSVKSSTEVQTITPGTGVDGFNSITVNAISLQTKTVDPTTSDQTITPDNGYDGLSSVTVNAIALQEKTANVSTSTQTVTPDSGYDGLSKVTVAPIILQSKTVTANGAYTADSNYDGLSQVTVNVPEPDLGTKTITANGIYTASSDSLDGFSSVTVNVESSGGSSDLVEVETLPASPDESKVYRIANAGNPTLYFVQGGEVMNVNDFASANGGSVVYITVDNINSVENPIPAANEATMTITIYVNKADNKMYGYMKTDGGAGWLPPSLFIAGEMLTDYGLVSTPPTSSSADGTYYTLDVAYGIPNASGSKKIYEYGNSWDNLEKYKELFERREYITTFEMPEGITRIATSTFNYCINLTSITIPDTVTEIWGEAFRLCVKLTSIVIPDSVTKIDDSAFNGCYQLASVTIGSGVTTIGTHAFFNCPITSITYNGTKAQWKAISISSDAFNNTGDYVITCTDGTIAKDGTET